MKKRRIKLNRGEGKKSIKGKNEKKKNIGKEDDERTCLKGGTAESLKEMTYEEERRWRQRRYGDERFSL